MPVLTIFFYVMLIIVVFLSFVGILLNRKIIWVVGAVWYVVSFLGSWSIGLYLLVLPFTIFTIALAHSIRLIKKPKHVALPLVLGMLLWIISITMVDDYWLFYPFSRLVG